MDGVLSIVAINNNTSLVPLRKRSPSNKSHVLIVHLAIPFSMRQIFNKKKRKIQLLISVQIQTPAH